MTGKRFNFNYRGDSYLRLWSAFLSFSVVNTHLFLTWLKFSPLLQFFMGCLVISLLAALREWTGHGQASFDCLLKYSLNVGILRVTVICFKVDVIVWEMDGCFPIPRIQKNETRCDQPELGTLGHKRWSHSKRTKLVISLWVLCVFDVLNCSAPPQ